MVNQSFQIEFEAEVELFDISKPAGDLIIHIPEAENSTLPSKGMVAVEGMVDESAFISICEPDGNGGHLLRFDSEFMQDLNKKPGHSVSITMEPAKEEIEIAVPIDLSDALANNSSAHDLWNSITPMARRDWIHWISNAKQAETRARRVEQTCSKLIDGKKRPCCFNNQCAVFNFDPS